MGFSPLRHLSAPFKLLQALRRGVVDGRSGYLCGSWLQGPGLQREQGVLALLLQARVDSVHLRELPRTCVLAF